MNCRGFRGWCQRPLILLFGETLPRCGVLSLVASFVAYLIINSISRFFFTLDEPRLVIRFAHHTPDIDQALRDRLPYESLLFSGPSLVVERLYCLIITKPRISLGFQLFTHF